MITIHPTLMTLVAREKRADDARGLLERQRAALAHQYAAASRPTKTTGQLRAVLAQRVSALGLRARTRTTHRPDMALTGRAVCCA